MAVSWEFIKIPLQMELFPFHSDWCGIKKVDSLFSKIS